MMMEPLDPITSCIYEIQYPSLDLSKDLDKKETETLDSTVKYPEAVETEESSRSGSFKWRTHEKQTRKKHWEVESRLREFKRICVDCQTTKTPLWRGGPAGPKSLCNACGIRYRKKRRAALGLKPEEKEKQGRRMKVGSPLKVQLLALEDDIYMQKSFSNVPILQKKRKLVKEEEEEAAALLMALSCGLLHA